MKAIEHTYPQFPFQNMPWLEVSLPEIFNTWYLASVLKFLKSIVEKQNNKHVHEKINNQSWDKLP
jgi:hypothetical protein